MSIREEKTSERARALTDETELHVPQPTSVRVYYVLAGSKHTAFDRDPKAPDSIRRFQLTAFTPPMLSTSAHRTRKALAVLLEKLHARGALSKDDVDDILLAAVDYCEPNPRYADVGGR